MPEQNLKLSFGQISIKWKRHCVLNGEAAVISRKELFVDLELL